MTLFNVEANGLITVDSSGMKESMENAYKDSLGANLNLEAGTPQGQMVITDTKMLAYAQEQCALIGNAFNVLSASGKALDVAGAFWGYYRKRGQKSVVRAVVRGTAGVEIPKGALVSDGTNNFELLEKVTISNEGSNSVQFQALKSGAITCPANTLTEIVTAISGWDSVYNPTSAILGYDEETDNQFRQRILANWLNIRARGELGSIMDNIAQLDGVLSVICRENMTNSQIVIDDVTLEPHSILVAVVGGDGSKIAEAIYRQKACGVGTNGDVQVSYLDASTGITNNYKIIRPDFKNIKIKVNYSENVYTPADVQDKIKDVVMQYVKENPFVIGQTISGYILAKAMYDFKYADFVSLKVAFQEALSYSDYINTKIDEIAVLDRANINCEEI